MDDDAIGHGERNHEGYARFRCWVGSRRRVARHGEKVWVQSDWDKHRSRAKRHELGQSEGVEVGSFSRCGRWEHQRPVTGRVDR